MNTLKEKQNIPKGWQQIKLGDIAQLRKGLIYKSSHYSNEQDGLIFLTLKSIQRGGGFNTDGIKYYAGNFDKNAIVKEGDLVIANTDITRNAEVVGAPMLLPKLKKEPALISMDLSAFDTDEKKVNKQFLYYLLQTPVARNFMKDHSSGSTVLHLKTKDVPGFNFLIPTIVEQKRIAEVLTAVDQQIQKVDEIIAATEKLKKGLVVKLFSDHIKNKKYKVGEISEVTSSKRVMVADYVEEGIPFYRSTEIIKKSKNLPVSNPLYISAEKFNFFKNRFGAPKAGDVLITAVGTIGDVYLVQDEAFYFKDGNTVWIRKIKDFVLPEYLSMILASSFYREKLNNIAGGSSQKALTIQKLENVEVPIPPKSEQEKLVGILSSIDEKISINQKLKEKLTLLKKGLMQDLLSGRVRINK
jgi:type I restriction enzyme, S subunit